MKVNRKMFGKTVSYYALAVGFLAFSCGFLHMYHVSTLFENDRHFSHLSTLEREMAFYTEMGLYYSYYKTLVEARTFLEGLRNIMRDDKTEYPLVINTLQRFNLFPEVVIAICYRGFIAITEKLNITTKHCWQVDRGNGLLPVLSCEGLGDPTYFYLEMVWLSAGLTTTVMFLYGHMLSGNILGGALAVVCFFFNHGESTRVQWTPPLRESFAYPFCLLQMVSFSRSLSLTVSSSDDTVKSASLQKMLMVWVPTWLTLVLWQFGQFVLTTQLLAVSLLFILGIVKRSTFIPILFGYLKKKLLNCITSDAFAVFHATFSLFVNQFLLFSFFNTTLVAIWFIAIVLEPMLKNLLYIVRVLIMCTLTPVSVIIIKSLMIYFIGYKDDMHIVNLLKAKFIGYKDFHTLLYTCSAEFDFLPWEYLKNISNTILLPSAILAFILVVFCWIKTINSLKGNKELVSITTKLRTIDPVIAYNFLQLIAFGIMATLIMRLKLFFTPHMCLMVSLLASRKYIPWQSREMRVAFLCVLVSAMSVKGIQNLKEQRDIVGEYSNVPMEQLLNWINTSTKPSAVFAGPMPLMANVLLSTRRPIVNHPHYEDANLRERTKNVYSVFSRRTPQEVYITLSKMEVDYVILGDIWCFGESKKGCSIKDLWDVEEPKNVYRPPVCPTLFHGNPTPFVRVFNNGVYVVLQVHSQSQFVEVHPKLYSQ